MVTAEQARIKTSIQINKSHYLHDSVISTLNYISKRIDEEIKNGKYEVVVTAPLEYILVIKDLLIVMGYHCTIQDTILRINWNAS